MMIVDAGWGLPLWLQAQNLQLLPSRNDIPGPKPSSWQEAQQIAQARDEEKLRQQQHKKDSHKKGPGSKGLTAQNDAPAAEPGLAIGSVAEASAFWMFVEDYFRDVCQEDLQLLIPHCLDVSQDDALYVPQLGRELARLQQGQAGQQGGRKAAAKVSQLVAAELGEDSLPIERRTGRQTGGRRDQPEDPFGGRPADGPEALAQGLQVTGQRCSTMLDACSTQELTQMLALLRKLGLVSLAPVDSAEVQAQLAAIKQDSGQYLQSHALLPPMAQQPDNTQDREALVQVLDSMASTIDYACAEPHSAASQQPDQPQQPQQQQLSAQLKQEPQAAGAAAVQQQPEQVKSQELTAEGKMDSEQGGGNQQQQPQDTTTSEPADGEQETPAAESTVADKEQQQPSAAAKGEGTGTEEGDAALTSNKSIQPAPRSKQLPFEGQLSEQGEYVHPFTQLLLARPPTLYVLDPSSSQAMAEDGDFDGDGLAAGTPAGAYGSSAKTPASSKAPHGSKNKQGKLTGKAAAARAAAAKAAAAAAASDAAAPAPSTSMMESAGPAAADDTAMSPAAADTASKGGPTGSAGHALPKRVASRSALDMEAEQYTGKTPVQTAAQRKKGSKLQKVTTASKLGGSSVNVRQRVELPPTPLAAAVAACCATGGPEVGLDQQWGVLDSNIDLLGAAPDDEMLTEILALQSELVQQMAINRKRVGGLLQRVVNDLPTQPPANEERAAMEATMKAYLQRKVEIKRNQKREQLLAKKAAKASLEASAAAAIEAGRPRPARPLKPSRLGEGGVVEGGDGPVPDLASLIEHAPGKLLEDNYAYRTGEEEEALCAVCGDGVSPEGNEIIFCERCDVAVHQDCYGLATIPDGEWLCYPCAEYEARQLAAGKPQSEVRPPRWEMAARGLAPGQLGGGSCDVKCALCPVKKGAFKRSEDSIDWVHLVCALWHTETDVIPGPHCDAVVGVKSVRAERWNTPCCICNQTQGATIKCAYGHCTHSFHPLCGRRIGNYLCTKANATFNKLIYRGYCHQHSPMMMLKDTPPDATKPAQAAVDIRRPEIRKEVQPAKPRNHKAGGGSGSRASVALEESMEEYGTGAKPHRANTKAGQATVTSPKTAVGPRKPGRPPGPNAKAKAAAVLPPLSAAGAEAAAAALAAGAYPIIPVFALTPKEQEAEQLRAVRHELDTVRNLLGVVQRRERLSRALSTAIVEMHQVSVQNPAEVVAAIHQVEGAEALQNLPPQTNYGLQAALIFEAARAAGASGAGSPAATPAGTATAAGGSASGAQLQSMGSGGTGKRKRDSVLSAPSKELALEQFMKAGVMTLVPPPPQQKEKGPSHKKKKVSHAAAAPQPPAAQLPGNMLASAAGAGSMDGSTASSLLSGAGSIQPGMGVQGAYPGFGLDASLMAPPPPAYESKRDNKRRKKGGAAAEPSPFAAMPMQQGQELQVPQPPGVLAQGGYAQTAPGMQFPSMPVPPPPPLMLPAAATAGPTGPVPKAPRTKKAGGKAAQAAAAEAAAAAAAAAAAPAAMQLTPAQGPAEALQAGLWGQLPMPMPLQQQQQQQIQPPLPVPQQPAQQGGSGQRAGRPQRHRQVSKRLLPLEGEEGGIGEGPTSPQGATTRQHRGGGGGGGAGDMLQAMAGMVSGGSQQQLAGLMPQPNSNPNPLSVEEDEALASFLDGADGLGAELFGSGNLDMGMGLGLDVGFSSLDMGQGMGQLMGQAGMPSLPSMSMLDQQQAAYQQPAAPPQPPSGRVTRGWNARNM